MPGWTVRRWPRRTSPERRRSSSSGIRTGADRLRASLEDPPGHTTAIAERLIGSGAAGVLIGDVSLVDRRTWPVPVASVFTKEQADLEKALAAGPLTVRIRVSPPVR